MPGLRIIAFARMAYQAFEGIFHGTRFVRLEEKEETLRVA